MNIESLEILDESQNLYENKRVMIGLSGGINSAAVLVYLAEKVEYKPKDIYLFYAHFDEHSSDTEKFVHDLVAYARTKFENVHFTQTQNSINEFFTIQKMIPHPMAAPCTRMLKIEPAAVFMETNKIDIDLVGYVRNEQRRIDNQQKRLLDELKDTKQYPIKHMTNENCFDLVKEHLGWYPAIYDLMWTDSRIVEFVEQHKCDIPEKHYKILMKYAKRGYGYKKENLRVFQHNNCLPCKNMQTWEFYIVKCFFPDYFEKAMQTAADISKITGKETYWGRNADELNSNGKSAACTFCAFD